MVVACPHNGGAYGPFTSGKVVRANNRWVSIYVRQGEGMQMRWVSCHDCRVIIVATVMLQVKVQLLCCCCCHVAVVHMRVCRPRAGFCGNQDEDEVCTKWVQW